MNPATAASSDPLPDAVLDSAALARLRDLDPGDRNGVFVRVMQTYLRSLRQTLDSLGAGAPADAAQVDSVRRLAHTLKSSSASVGALRLARLCDKTEALAREQQLQAMTQALVALREEALRVAGAVQELLQAEGAPAA